MLLFICYIHPSSEHLNETLVFPFSCFMVCTILLLLLCSLDLPSPFISLLQALCTITDGLYAIRDDAAEEIQRVNRHEDIKHTTTWPREGAIISMNKPPRQRNQTTNGPCNIVCWIIQKLNYRKAHQYNSWWVKSAHACLFLCLNALCYL